MTMAEELYVRFMMHISSIIIIKGLKGYQSVTDWHESTRRGPYYSTKQDNKCQAILKLIEDRRMTLGELIDSKGFSAPEVIAASQELDALLNKYYRLLEEEEEGRNLDERLETTPNQYNLQPKDCRNKPDKDR